MMKHRALLLAVALLQASPAAAGEATAWPPQDPSQETAAVAITADWAESVRDIRNFAGLQKAAGAQGRLETVEDVGQVSRAVFDWAGAGGKGAMRAFLYRNGDFGAVVSPSDDGAAIIVNSFGAFVCPSCKPPVNSCGRRPSWVSREVHWDTFDCGCTLTGPQSAPGGRC